MQGCDSCWRGCENLLLEPRKWGPARCRLAQAFLEREGERRQAPRTPPWTRPPAAHEQSRASAAPPAASPGAGPSALGGAQYPSAGEYASEQGDDPMEGIVDEETVAPAPSTAAGSARGRARLEPLAEVVRAERYLPSPPVVREGLIPIMGMEEQGNALLRGATLVHTKKGRERAHKFVNHQCRWLDDAAYRMTASGMGENVLLRCGVVRRLLEGRGDW